MGSNRRWEHLENTVNQYVSDHIGDQTGGIDYTDAVNYDNEYFNTSDLSCWAVVEFAKWGGLKDDPAQLQISLCQVLAYNDGTNDIRDGQKTLIRKMRDDFIEMLNVWDSTANRAGIPLYDYTDTSNPVQFDPRQLICFIAKPISKDDFSIEKDQKRGNETVAIQKMHYKTYIDRDLYH